MALSAAANSFGGMHRVTSTEFQPASAGHTWTRWSPPISQTQGPPWAGLLFRSWPTGWRRRRSRGSCSSWPSRRCSGGTTSTSWGPPPEGKDAAAVEAKLLAKYAVAASRWARARRKRADLANHHYLRYGRFFVLLATHGESRFFAEEAAVIRDARRVPIRFGMYGIGYSGRHVVVQIKAHLYRDLKGLPVLRSPGASQVLAPHRVACPLALLPPALPCGFLGQGLLPRPGRIPRPRPSSPRRRRSQPATGTPSPGGRRRAGRPRRRSAAPRTLRGTAACGHRGPEGDDSPAQHLLCFCRMCRVARRHLGPWPGQFGGGHGGFSYTPRPRPAGMPRP